MDLLVSDQAVLREYVSVSLCVCVHIVSLCVKEIIDLWNNSEEKLPKYFACLKPSLLGENNQIASCEELFH